MASPTKSQIASATAALLVVGAYGAVAGPGTSLDLGGTGSVDANTTATATPTPTPTSTPTATASPTPTPTATPSPTPTPTPTPTQTPTPTPTPTPDYRTWLEDSGTITETNSTYQFNVDVTNTGEAAVETTLVLEVHSNGTGTDTIIMKDTQQTVAIGPGETITISAEMDKSRFQEYDSGTPQEATIRVYSATAA